MRAGTHPAPTVLDVLLRYWPTLLFVPLILLVIATLVAVTWVWDRRDARAAQRVVRARRAQSLRPWRMRTRCDCSWHTMSAPATTGRPSIS